MSPEAALVTVSAIGAVALIVKWSIGLAKEALVPPTVPEMPDMIHGPLEFAGGDTFPEPELDPKTQERVNRYSEFMDAANKLDRKAHQEALEGRILTERSLRESADKLRERAREALDE